MKRIIIIFFVFLSSFSSAQVWSDHINGLDSLWNNTGADADIFDLLNINDSLLIIGGAYKHANNTFVNGFVIFNQDTITASVLLTQMDWNAFIPMMMTCLLVGGSLMFATIVIFGIL
jgi:hypothetical protein